MPWYIAGTAVGVAIFVLVFALLRDDQPATSFARQGPIPMGQQPFTPGQAPPLTGTLREQADRLFNRVMQARESGDNEQVTMFLPMAMEAYRQSGNLDADGLFHLSLIENLAGQAAAARATAERILADQPGHLLGLAAAAEAASLSGDQAGALEYHRRFLDAWETESVRPLSEYLDHGAMLPEYRLTAQRAVGR
jgi:hypothetical protein